MSKLIKLLVLVFISTMSLAQSVKIEIEEYLQTDFEFIFEIKNQNFKKVVVDCQGFINNVNIELENGHKDILVLDVFECEEIHEMIVTNLSEKDSACLKIDFEKRWYGVTPSCE